RLLPRETLAETERRVLGRVGIAARDGAEEPTHGVERLDGIVGPEGERRPDLEERAPGITRPATLDPETRDGDLHVAREVDRLDARDDAHGARAGNVHGTEDLPVLDPVTGKAQALGAVGARDGLEGIERERDRPIADRVETDLETLRVRLDDTGRELVL